MKTITKLFAVCCCASLFAACSSTQNVSGQVGCGCTGCETGVCACDCGADCSCGQVGGCDCCEDGCAGCEMGAASCCGTGEGKADGECCGTCAG